MTTSNPSIIAAARSDPVGAGIVICAVSLIALLIVGFLPPMGPETWQLRWPNIPDLIGYPRPVQRPLERPPIAWRTSAPSSDILIVPERTVWYWGRPDAHYSGLTAAKPLGIVVHFTDDTPVQRLVRYGHSLDPTRGGASYGYHVYIDQAGRILQGAPLGRRTNHIKPIGAGPRTGTAPHLDSSNSIGVSLIGACKSPPLSPITYRCTEETATAEQIESGLAVIRALQARYGLACGAVWGHGDLQTDRRSFEGQTLSRRARLGC